MSNPAAVIANAAKVMVVPGVAAAATITLPQAIASIDAVFAIVTASGAFATKSLLAVTTDYTLSADKKTLTCVTNQSAATLLIIGK